MAQLSHKDSGMRKVNKVTRGELNKALSEVDSAAGELEAVGEEIACVLRKALQTAKLSNGHTIEEMFAEFSNAKEKAKNLINNIKQDVENYSSDRSDAWQESESAERYEDWSQQLDDSLNEIDELLPEISISGDFESEQLISFCSDISFSTNAEDVSVPLSIDDVN